jgi:4-hydroxy-tetrahydrodipicolinate synthase
MHYLRKELGEEVAFYNGSNPLPLLHFPQVPMAGVRFPNLILSLNIEL